MRQFLLTLLLSIFSFQLVSAYQKDSLAITSLLERINRLVEVNDIPAIGLAIIDQDGNEYARSFGLQNIEKNIAATENSMFRIGSVSKIFVALAILKLQEDGKLSLEDKVNELVPDVEYENEWKETHPILVKHLLNHTTGWDDLHGIEWSVNDPKPLSTKEGIDIHSHSRISRWAPGTRMAYSNSGAAIAAYIVEKLTGLTIDEYVKMNFFDPLGMKNSGYLYSEVYQELGVVNYKYGVPEPYYHISYRAAGAISSSPREMLQLIKLFINQGTRDSMNIISKQSIEVMETSPEEFGLNHGYGLCNFSSEYSGFVFQGHNGAVNNALATFIYLPEYKLGYALMMSEMNSKSFKRINDLVKEYLVNGLEPEKSELKVAPESHDKSIEGYYLPSSPRNQKFYIISHLFEPVKISFNDDTLRMGPAFGKSIKKYVPVEPGVYASVTTSHHGLTMKKDIDGSRILYKAVFGGVQAFKPVSGFMVYGRVALFSFTLILSFTSLFFALVWLIFLLKKDINFKGFMLRYSTVLTSLLFLSTLVFLLYLMNNPFRLLFTPNGLSYTLLVLTLIYPLLSISSPLVIIRNKEAIGRGTSVYLLIVSLTHVLMTTYLFSQNMIGIRTWY